MKTTKYFLRYNRCYQQGKKRIPIGIQIHSIGTGQGTAKSVADYWNQGSASECVTYICDADVPGNVLQLLPEDFYTWADAGFGNGHLITIEMCESDVISYKPNSANYVVKNSATFEADIRRSYQTAVELCADICKRYGWNPRAKLSNGLYLISSHDEGRKAGLSSAHVDPTHIWTRFGLSMDGFRTDVIKYMGKASDTPETPQNTPEEAWIAKIAPIAQSLYQKTRILPSVVIAQTALETGWGKTDLAQQCNNLVGMKADLINNTWKDYSVWNGTTYTKETPEYRNGVLVRITDVFRVYKSYTQCLTDYEMFLLHVRNDKGLKYARIAGMKDPVDVIHAIRIGTGTDKRPEGYCTDPNYEAKIMGIINKYSLTFFDGDYMPVPEPSKVIYRVQVGAHKTKGNADKRANKVKSITGFDCFVEYTDKYRVICGSYKNKANAEKRAEQIRSAGLKASIKEK